MDIKTIKLREQEWTRKHTLTPEQREEIIAQKLELAKVQSKVNAKTEKELA